MFSAEVNTRGITSFSKSLELNLQTELDNITLKIQEEVKDAVPKDTGALSASISVQTSKGTDMERNISAVTSINPRAKIVTPMFGSNKFSNSIFSVVNYATINELGGNGRAGLFSFSRVLAANKPIFMLNMLNAVKRSK